MTLAEYMRRFDEANDHAFTYYRLLKETRRLNSVTRATVRCARGCALLTIFETPAGPAFHMPRYKLSPTVNLAESNADGRAANTEDGERYWKERAGMMTAALNFTLACDHTRTILEKEDLELGVPGKPTRRVLT